LYVRLEEMSKAVLEQFNGGLGLKEVMVRRNRGIEGERFTKYFRKN